MTGSEVVIPIQYHHMPNHSLFVAKPPEHLYHYTTLEGAAGIMSSQSLRLTHIRYLNDTSELSHGMRAFRTAALERAKEVSDSRARQFLEKAAHQVQSMENINICVASFCDAPNLLSQWRGYGRTGGAVALGFATRILDVSLLQGHTQLWKCIYDQHDQRIISFELVDLLLNSYKAVDGPSLKAAEWERSERNLIGFFNTTFLRVAPMLKNPHFKEEREWRIISAPIDADDPHFFCMINNRRTYLYYDLAFKEHERLIYRIIEGPSPRPMLNLTALDVHARKKGFRVTSLQPCNIPFRPV